MNPEIAKEISRLVKERGGFVNAHSHLDIAWGVPCTLRMVRLSCKSGSTI